MVMEMEVVVPAPDFFNFGSPCSSYYLTAPSTPHPPFFATSSISAPTSPSHASNFYHHDDDVPIGSPSAVPFRWEEKPGIPKSPKTTGEDFEFNCGGQLLNKASLSADELFDGGKIKPLKPPPGFQVQVNDFSISKLNTSSPRSPHNLKLSPRNKNDIVDPFEAALIKETRSHSSNELRPQQRGRDKISYISSNFARKGTRSLSPFRMSETILDEDDNDTDNSLPATATIKAKSSSFLSAISFPKGNRKWRLRDLLFRSTSEGRATEKAHDQLRTTYVVMSKKVDDDVKNSSFRSADSNGSRRRGPVSGREMQYTAANRAVSEELKKKSFLPHKQGLLGRCLRLNRQGMQEISRGIGSLTRG